MAMKSMAIPLKCDGKLGRPVQVPRTKQVYERKLLSKPIDILDIARTALAALLVKHIKILYNVDLTAESEALAKQLTEPTSSVKAKATGTADRPRDLVLRMHEIARRIVVAASTQRVAIPSDDPDEFARKIVDAINKAGLSAADSVTGSRIVSDVVAAGKFINFTLATAFLGQVVDAITDGSFLSPLSSEGRDRVMIEYSQPNTHKAFHVGHMRNAALGESLVRCFEQVGHPVVAANYFGDEGQHIATCLWQMQCEAKQKGIEVRTLLDAVPETERGEWLGGFYSRGVEALSLDALTSLPYSGVAAAYVKSKEAHPSVYAPPNWHVVEVVYGTEAATVVCGGADYKVGDLVAYVPVGSRFNNATVSPMDKQGIVSRGIILSKRELGIEDDGGRNNEHRPSAAIHTINTVNSVNSANVVRTVNAINAINAAGAKPQKEEKPKAGKGEDKIKAASSSLAQTPISVPAPIIESKIQLKVEPATTKTPDPKKEQVKNVTKAKSRSKAGSKSEKGTDAKITVRPSVSIQPLVNEIENVAEGGSNDNKGNSTDKHKKNAAGIQPPQASVCTAAATLEKANGEITKDQTIAGSKAGKQSREGKKKIDTSSSQIFLLNHLKGIEHGFRLTEFGRKNGAVAKEKTVEEEHKERLDQSKALLRAMENKDAFLRPLWEETAQWSFDEFANIYTWLGSPFDENFTESEVSQMSLSMVEKLLTEGKLDELPSISKHPDTGIQQAIGIDLEKRGFKGYGFCMLRKSNGSGLYATKDLSLAKVKFDRHNIDRSIYVVASEQSHHFKQVFKSLEVLGYEQAKKCHHLAYGMVKLASGKMSSRKGTVVFFSALKQDMWNYFVNALFHHRIYDMWSKEQFFRALLFNLADKKKWYKRDIVAAIEFVGPKSIWPRSVLQSLQRVFNSGAISDNKEWDNASIEAVIRQFVVPHEEKLWTPEEVRHAVHVLSVAAIKYGMLNQNCSTDIVFELEAWSKHTGNTGPYLLMAYARMRSIIANVSARTDIDIKGTNADFGVFEEIKEGKLQQRALLLKMNEFWPTIQGVVNSYNPAQLCDYLSSMCRDFSSWYEEVPYLTRETDAVVLVTRLKLIEALSLVLQKGLSLLGIQTCERL